MNLSQPKRVRILLALVVAVFAFWWFETPPPLVGGGQEDGILAQWVRNHAYNSIPPAEDHQFRRLTLDNANGWYAISREPLQTFDGYVRQHPARPTPERRTLVLQPLGPMQPRDWVSLREVRDYCAVFFQIPTRIAAPLSLDAVKNDSRPQQARRNVATGDKQYDAAKIIDKILMPRLPDDAAAYLGVTMADLYVEGLSFNFGLASDRTGVYSLARYRNAFWSQKPKPDNERLVLRRACLLLSHETGHMFGITHCTFYKCAMNGANSLGDADDTPLAFCPICRRKLEWNLGCNPQKRKSELAHFYQLHGLEKMLVKVSP